MELDVSNTDTDLLVYRDAVHSFFGCSLIAVSTGISLAMLARLFNALPENQSGYIACLILCGFAWALGLQMLVRKSLKLDRKHLVMTKSTALLFIPLSSKKIDTSRFNALKWTPRTVDDSTSYEICFSSATEQAVVFHAPTMLGAKKHTRDIAQFFGLDQIHWDANLPASCGSSRTTHKLHIVVGHKPWVVQSSDSTRLEFTQRFEAFLIFAAFVFGFIGVSALILTILGFQVNGTAQVRMIGSVIFLLFVLLPIVFLFGKRGVTFDSSNRTVSIWWGIVNPLWTRRHDICENSTIVIEKSVEEVAGVPCQLSKLVLCGPNLRLVVFRTSYDDQIAAFAPMIAEHMSIPFDKSTPATPFSN